MLFPNICSISTILWGFLSAWGSEGGQLPAVLELSICTFPDHHCLEQSINLADEGLVHHWSAHPIQGVVRYPDRAGRAAEGCPGLSLSRCEWPVLHLFPDSRAAQIQTLGHLPAGREHLGRLLVAASRGWARLWGLANWAGETVKYLLWCLLFFFFFEVQKSLSSLGWSPWTWEEFIINQRWPASTYWWPQLAAARRQVMVSAYLLCWVVFS